MSLDSAGSAHRRRGIPRVHISDRGRILFNKAAAQMVEGWQQVALAYDAERHRVAIQPLAEAGRNAYPFELRRTALGASIPAKKFFDHFRVSLPRDAEIGIENGCIVLQLSA